MVKDGYDGDEEEDSEAKDWDIKHTLRERRRRLRLWEIPLPVKFFAVVHWPNLLSHCEKGRLSGMTTFQDLIGGKVDTRWRHYLYLDAGILQLAGSRATSENDYIIRILVAKNYKFLCRI